MLFGLTSPEMILSKTGEKILPECTLKIEYVNAYRTCGICGAAVSIREELPASIFNGSEYEEIWKIDIEVKAGSDEYLAKKCSSYMRQRGIFLIMILPIIWSI